MKYIKSLIADSRKFIDNDKEHNTQTNYSYLKVMSLVYIAYLVAYFLIVCIAQAIKIQSILIVVGLVLQIFLTLNIYNAKNVTYKRVRNYCSIFGSLILLLAACHGLFVTPKLPALLFPLMIVLMSQIYTLPLKDTFMLISIATVVYLIAALIIKPMNIALTDCVTTITAYSVSGISAFSLMRYKVTEYQSRVDYKHLSQMDQMTGILNKTAFEFQYEQFLSVDHFRKYGLLIIDIDDFKSINDKYGHSFGDRVLVDFCAEIQKFFSKFESECYIGRFGGDEFMILITDADSKDIIIRNVNELMISISSRLSSKYGIEITCSVGVSISNSTKEKYSDMFEHADSSLFAAKENGKKQYKIYDGEKV